MANFGVHAGFVYRQIDQLYQSDNLNRPVSAFNVPITVRDPEPERHASLRAGRRLQAWNLNPANLRAAGRQLPAQHAGQGRFLQPRAERESGA